MEFIKNRLKYNTEKSKLIAIFNNDTVLYKTNKGNWFTYVEMRNDFTVLTENEAEQLMEKHGRYKLIEEYFSEEIQDA